VLKGSDGRIVLVDSGFYREKFVTRWKVQNFSTPAEAVARFGIRPDQVPDIIITHMHWDHADGQDLFPKATVWIQKDEYEYYTGEAWQDSKRRGGGADPDVMLALVKRNFTGQLRLVGGDNQTIIPGLTCYTGGRHTYASQYVGVNTVSGTACSRPTTCMCSRTSTRIGRSRRHSMPPRTFRRRTGCARSPREPASSSRGTTRRYSRASARSNVPLVSFRSRRIVPAPPADVALSICVRSVSE
jgi:hypothetical protein